MMPGEAGGIPAQAAGVVPAEAGTQGIRIAVLGARGTGGTQLSAQLREQLARDADVTVVEGSPIGERPDATLLMGLDLPTSAGGEAEDALLRTQLQAAGLPFQVVYGTGPQRLRSALAALDAAGVLPAGRVRREEEGGASRAWTWACEKCSDPACEHRLFTRLRRER